MLVFLHRNCADLVKLTATAEHAKFGATTAVRVSEEPDGLYRCEATDGRKVVIIRGPFNPNAEDVPFLEDGAPDVKQFYVPDDLWQQAFKMPGPGHNGKSKEYMLGLASDKDGGLIFSTGPSTLHVPQQVEGRYPDVDKVLPGKAPLFSVRLDPHLLLEVLNMAKRFLADQDESRSVHLLYYGADKPVGISTRNLETGQAFDALVVPLVEKS